MPKSALAIAGIGVCSLILAIVIVSGNHHATPLAVKQVSDTGKDTPSHQSGDTGIADSDSQASAHISGNSGGPATAPAANRQATAATPAGSSAKAANNTQNGSSTGTAAKSTPASPTPSPSTPKAGYNLNENWYISIVGVAGLFNSCWPTPLTQDNEATCGDLNSPYTHVLIEGVGVSKNPDTAYTLAADNAQQKADAQHVDVRRGGGGDPVILTEALCSQYGLSCARW